MNALKTALLLGLLSSVLIVGGGAIAGQQGLVMGLVLAVGMNFFSYFYSDKMALSMYRAQPVTPEQNTAIYNRVSPLVQQLTVRMGLPMPKLWVIPERTPNAFATGRDPNHASVAITAGLLEMMTDRELEGVVAHELGHVRHRDILISSIAATVASAITYLSYFGMFFGGGRDDEDGGPMAALAMMILGPMAAGLIQMAISRTREFSADNAAAQYTGSPDGLISALKKLDAGASRIPMQHGDPSTAHMFIMNPFRAGGMARLFSTHPSTEERIRNLEAQRGAIHPV